MTAWAPLLVPAGSAAFGGLIGAGSAIWAQVITHRGTTAREREARLDAFKIKRFESERETLVALQDTIQEMHGLIARRYLSGKRPDEFDDNPRLNDLQAAINKLASRTLATEARASTLFYLAAATTTGSDPSSFKEHGYPEAFSKAMLELGMAIVQDPFNDHSLRLTPPAPVDPAS